MINLIWKLKRIIKVIKHPIGSKCYEDECAFCAILDCPNDSPEHYWHDGCPPCWGADTNGYRTNYIKNDYPILQTNKE